MNYPLPPFPIEIINEIAKNDPETFRRLVLTSERLRKNLGPALKFHCRRDISVLELLKHLRDSSPFTISLSTPILPLGRKVVSISYLSGTFTLEVIGGKRSIYSFEFPGLLETLLERGYRLDLKETFKILQRRISCLEFDPDFARRTIWEIFETRFRMELASLTPNNLDFIFIPYGIIVDLFVTLGLEQKIKEIDFPFYRTNEDILDFYRRFLSNLPEFRSLFLR